MVGVEHVTCGGGGKGALTRGFSFLSIPVANRPSPSTWCNPQRHPHDQLAATSSLLSRYLEAIAAYDVAAYDHVFIHQLGPDQEKGLRFLAEEVLPELKQRGLRERLADTNRHPLLIRCPIVLLSVDFPQWLAPCRSPGELRSALRFKYEERRGSS